MLWVKKSILTYIGITQQCTNCSKAAGGYISHGSGSPSGKSGLDSSSASDDCLVLDTEPHKNTKAGGKDRGRKSKAIKQVHVLSSVEPLLLPKQNLQQVSVSAHCSQNYDNYSSSPLYNKSLPTLPGIWTFDNTGAPIIPEVWASWRDRGYQLHHLFFLSITSANPTMHEDHLFPFSIQTSSFNGGPQRYDNVFL